MKKKDLFLRLNIQLFADPDDDIVKDDTVVTDDTVKDDKGVSGDLKFSQADVDKIVIERIAREKKGLPSKEELDAFAQYKESQKTEQEKRDEEVVRLKAENEKFKGELTNTKQDNLIIANNVNAEYRNYIKFEVNAMVTADKDFKTCFDEFKAANPRYFVEDKKQTNFENPAQKTTTSSEPSWKNHLSNKYKR